MMSPILKAKMPLLNPIFNKSHEKVGEPQWSLSSEVGLQAHKIIARPPKAAPCRNPARSYAAVAVSGPAHKLHVGKNLLIEELPWTRHQLLLRVMFLQSKKTEGFKTGTYREKITTGTPEVITVKHRRLPLVGVRNSASLPKLKIKLRGLSPQANYTDRTTTACRWS
jgi:hypothetical protein